MPNHQIVGRRFDGTNIREIGSNVCVEDSTFYGCSLDTTLILVELRRCILTRCSLTGTRLNRCKISSCKFQDCVIVGSEISSSLWQSTDLAGCLLANVNWNDCVIEASVVGCTVSNLSMRDCTVDRLGIVGTNGNLSFESSRIARLEFSRCDLNIRTRHCTVDRVTSEYSRLTLFGSDISMVYIGQDHPIIVTPSFVSMGNVCESELSILSKHQPIIDAVRRAMGWRSNK